VTAENLRRIDALVAERVMGWTIQLIVDRERSFEEWRDAKGWIHGSTPPLYTTSWDAAGQVVERMCAVGFSFEFHRRTETTWEASFAGSDYDADGDPVRFGFDIDASGPTATSVAALRALGVQVPA
jgi:hypothetical protein